MSLENKTAIITGANSGIGLSTCVLFAKEKCKVIAIDIADEINNELKLKLATLQQDFWYFQCDVSDAAQVEKTIANILEKGINFDILVNNAGILGPRKKVEDYPNDVFDKVMNINVNGVFYFMKYTLSHFAKKQSGVIVNTASVAGHLGMAGHIAYDASKHAVIGMTKTAAIEYAKNGIRVNAVCPGFTQTSMLANADADAEYLNTLKYVTPMRRFGDSSEIASAILFLASDASSFMTGQSIILDGGLAAQ